MKSLFSAFIHSQHFKRNLIIIIASILVVAMGITGTVLIVNHNKDDDDGETSTVTGKQIPIYEGMSIHTIKEASAAAYGNNKTEVGKEDFDYDKDNGNHNGHFMGDTTDPDDELDEENPFPDNSENENIEEEIKSTITVAGSPIDIYYATPNEYIYIYIHIKNPDNFEIMSFTLNGQKYSSYMFEDGSDMQTIILKYNVGETSGIVEYTIDAIKYIDNTEIKDVILEGDKTVKAGIRVDGQVSADVADLNVGLTDISFNTFIKDSNSLVEIFDGSFKAVLYDGTNIVAQKDLAVGNNSVSFTGLNTNTVYEYAVVGYYDDLSGKGYGMNVLYSEAIRTDAVTLFSDITLTSDSISFSLNWHPNHSTDQATAIKLYKGTELVGTYPADTRYFDNLLSDTVYSAVAEYTFNGKTESICVNFITATNDEPTVSIANTDKTQTGLGFSVSYVDTDSVGAITKVELLNGNNSTELNIADTYNLTDLLSANEYTLKVTYTYDLNDGNGAKTKTQSITVSTIAKTMPEILISSGNATKNSLSFAIGVVDTDSVGAITKVELLNANEATRTLSQALEHTVNGLLSDNTYTLKVTYTYDLNDGNGARELVATFDAKTEAMLTPSISIINTDKTKDTISFGISETDADSVGAISKIELISSFGTIVADDNSAREFTGLHSSTVYTLRVSYTYNLSDGKGDVVIYDTKEIKTVAKDTPSVIFSYTGKTDSTVSFAITEVDADNTGAITRVDLLLGDDVIRMTDDATVTEFTGLLSNTEYTLRLTYVYNLGDGNDSTTVVKTTTVTTDSLTVPTIIISGVSVTQSNMSFTVEETDPSNIGSISKIELYRGSELVKIVDANVREFTDLLTNSEYTVKVAYVYDLNNGNGQNTTIIEHKFSTAAMTVPSVEIINPTSGLDYVAFGIYESDTDNIGQITKIELISNNGTIIADSTEIRQFTGLLSNTKYTVCVHYTYNLSDGIGNTTVTVSADITTTVKATPNVSFSGTNTTASSITFAYTEVDIDNVGALTKIELLLGNEVVGAITDTTVNKFEGLLSNSSYTLRITYVYNLNDGNGEQTIVKTQTVKTESKTIPSVLLSGTSQTQSSISFLIDENDQHDVGQITAIELYRGTELVQTAPSNAIRSFTGLYASTAYTVKVTYTYDLGDGMGAVTVTYTTEITTENKTTPSVTFSGTNSTASEVSFVINEVDTSNAGRITKIELIYGNDVIRTTTDGTVNKFEGLSSNTTYTVKLTYVYNLDDGMGDVTVEKTVSITTRENNRPSILISGAGQTQSSVSFSIEEGDPSSVGQIEKIELYLDTTLVQTTADATVRSFSSLYSNTTYTVKVTYTYDLGDGNGTQTITDTANITTLAMAAPSISFESLDRTKTSISFSFNIVDISNAGAIKRIELIKNGNVVKYTTDADATGFQDVLSDTTYMVKVIYEYDLCDGYGARTIERTQSITTYAMSAPSFSIYEGTSTQSSVSFTTSETDVDGIGQIEKIELIHGNDTVEADSTDVRSFSGLLSGNTYTLRVTYVYNLNNGSSNTRIVRELRISTIAKTTPTVYITNTSATQTSLGFSITSYDPDSTGAVSKVELVHGATVTELTNAATVLATDLLSGNNYTLRVTYTYDLNDGYGARTLTRTYTASTSSKATPNVQITNTSSTQTSVSFSFYENDADNTGAITKIELIHADSTVVADSTEVREFTGLLSGNSYTVRITYVYNLNDGNGDYEITRTADINTVAKRTPTISIGGTATTSVSLTFSINETDADNVGTITKIELVHDSATVEASSTDVREFTGLFSNNDYTVRVTYVYDLNDGSGQRETVVTGTARTRAKAAPEVSIINLVATKNSISFVVNEIDADDAGAVTKIELIHGDDIIVADSNDIREFTSLLSNNSYTVRITYVYSLNDGTSAQTVVRSASIRTGAMSTPKVTLTNTDKTFTTLDFSISVNDADSVGAITKVELIHGEEVTVLENVTVHSLTDLYTNNEYTLRVTYTYDLSDGTGEKTIVKEVTARTIAKSIPTFTVSDEYVTIGSISAEHSVTDTNGVMKDYTVELYKGETKVQDGVDKTISFAGLEHHTEYTVKFVYTYDLGDGEGEKTGYYSYTFKTNPLINVLECSIANTSAVSEGETIFMSIKLDNPDDMTIKSVVINGITYDITDSSTSKKIFVEIVHHDQFAGGDTYLEVDVLNAEIDGKSYAVVPNTTMSDNVFINGKVTVKSIQYVNSELEPYEEGVWIYPSEQVYVLITVDNPTGYVIDSFSGYTKIDDNRYYYAHSNSGYSNYNYQYYGWIQSTSISSLNYHNDNITKSVSLATAYVDHRSIYRVRSNDVRYISTPSDILNMDDGYYYELACDIDLDGIEWQGMSFSGVLNGKGYSVKNMSFVSTVSNREAHLGLFSSFYGIMEDLHIEEATVIAEITSDDGNSYRAYCGGLIAYVDGRTYLNNCSVDEYSVFDVTGHSGGCYVGGLVGYAGSTITIIGSTNSGNISSTDYAGGLVGYARYTTTITGSTNSGNVSGYCAGGMLGGTYDSSGYTITITDSANSGNVSSTYYAGGLVGRAYYDTTITGSNNSGDVSANTSSSSAYAGGLVGYANSYTTITGSANSGNVSSTYYAGGLVGYARYTTTITGSTNSGNVSGSYAGGMLGGTYDSSGYTITITDSTNSGNVSSTYYAGGLVGYANSYTTITGSTNSGDVSANTSSSSAYAGGLVGYAYYDTTITGSTNSGNISSSGRAGGLVGGNNSYNNNTITIIDSANSGDVSSTSYAGGLVGCANSNTTITDCLNLGVLKENEAVVHGLVGNSSTVNYGTNSYDMTYYSDYDGMDHTYVFDTNGGEALSTATSKFAITLPTPVKEGYFFRGWYNNAELEGNPVTTYYSTTANTLYAKWDRIVDGVIYELSDNGTYYSVTGYIEGITDCVIQDSIDEIPVTNINDSVFSNCSTLKALTIGNNVTSIGSYEFSGCTGLVSLTIGSGVKEIGNRAFYNCTAIEKIYFNAVAMNDLSSGNYVFYRAGRNGAGIDVVIGEQVTKIPAYLFYPYSDYYPKVVSVSFAEDSVCNSIGAYAFRYCYALTDIKIPESIARIGNYAFANCSALTILCEATTKPSGWSSDWCSSVGQVIWGYTGYEYTYTFDPNGGENIDGITTAEVLTLPTPIREGYYFRGWYDNAELTGSPVNTRYYSTTVHTLYAKWDVVVDNVIYGLSDDGTYYSVTGYIEGITDCVIRDSIDDIPVTYINGSAFYGCSTLKTLTIGENVTYIGESSFYGCTGLDKICYNATAVTSSNRNIFKNAGSNSTGIEVVIGAKVTRMPDYIFYTSDGGSTAPNVKSVSYSEGSVCEYIGDYAFYNCGNLVSIQIPESVSYIGNYAFYGCYSLSEIVIPYRTTTVGCNAFYGCTKLQISCVALSKPTGWNSNWNPTNCSVIWNCKATGDEYTYTFEVNGGNKLDKIVSADAITLPTPEREGHYFLGWYDNADFDGDTYSGLYYNACDMTFYARWMSEEEFRAMRDGTSMEKAFITESGESYTAVIDSPGEYVYYEFVAGYDGYYTFYSSGTGDSYGYVYDSNGSIMASDDDGAGNNNNFRIDIYLNAGQTYYVGVRLYSSDRTGSFTVHIP